MTADHTFRCRRCWEQRALAAALAVACVARSVATSDTTAVGRASTVDSVLSPEVELSPQMRRALDAAFSLAPMQPAVVPRGDELTVEQLHSWVGPTPEVGSSTSLTADYFRYKCYLKDFESLKFEPTEVAIPGLREAIGVAAADATARRHLNLGTVSVDANHALSMLFSRHYRTIVRAQRLADGHRTAIDDALPMADGAAPRTADKVGSRTAVTSLPWWAEWLKKK